jgi:hypothetical protein
VPRTRTLTALILLAAPLTSRACQFHDLLSQSEPTGIWPTFSATYTDSHPSALTVLPSIATVTATITDPAITTWMLNTTGKKGHSPNATINAVVSLIDADVQTVAYNATSVYIKTNGIPSHDVGPFTGNPNIPAAQNRTARIPRAPQVQSGTKASVGLGNIGIMVNGATFFDPRDAMSYQNQNVWHQNANVFEAVSFDAAPGHPQQQGTYHYHQKPVALLNQIDPANTGQRHSRLIGFAFDGFPIYGPYGYANADGTGGIVRERSGYQPRAITQRTTLASGATVTAGPAVSAQYPLGDYIEDYAYTPGSGDLDQYNGRFVITPDYPSGTYAYFTTQDAAGAPAYPYIIGPQYYGVVDTGNLGTGTIVVPNDVTFYTAPEPSAAMLLVAATLLVFSRRCNRRSRGGGCVNTGYPPQSPLHDAEV